MELGRFIYSAGSLPSGKTWVKTYKKGGMLLQLTNSYQFPGQKDERIKGYKKQISQKCRSVNNRYFNKYNHPE